MRYSIYKKDDSEEHHFHEAGGNARGCRSFEYSLCEKSFKTGSSLVASCLSADKARRKAAIIGGTFCSVCVSHLYQNY